jgi:hypothetical protein
MVLLQSLTSARRGHLRQDEMALKEMHSRFTMRNELIEHDRRSIKLRLGLMLGVKKFLGPQRRLPAPNLRIGS